MDSAENVKSNIKLAISFKILQKGKHDRELAALFTKNATDQNQFTQEQFNKIVNIVVDSVNGLIIVFNTNSSVNPISLLDVEDIVSVIESRKSAGELNHDILENILEPTIDALCAPNELFRNLIAEMLFQPSAQDNSVKPVLLIVDAEPVDPSVVVGQPVDDDQPVVVGQTGDHAQPVIGETMEREAEHDETSQQRLARIQRIPRCISNWSAKLTRATCCTSILSGVANCTLATNAGSTGMLIADPTFTTFIASAAGSALCYIAYNCLNMQYNMEGTGLIQCTRETCFAGGSKTKKRRNKSRKTLRRKKQKRTRRAKMNKRNNIKK
jgi:hypothetical protein